MGEPAWDLALLQIMGSCNCTGYKLGLGTMYLAANLHPYQYDRCLSDISPLQVTLNSMHRYLPRIVISKHLSKKNLVVVHSQDFHECCFIAVTAYQNDKVSRFEFVCIYVFIVCDTVLMKIEYPFKCSICCNCIITCASNIPIHQPHIKRILYTYLVNAYSEYCTFYF